MTQLWTLDFGLWTHEPWSFDSGSKLDALQTLRDQPRDGRMGRASVWSARSLLPLSTATPITCRRLGDFGLWTLDFGLMLPVEPPFLACFKKPPQFNRVGLTGAQLDGIDPGGAEEANQIRLRLCLP